jgi:tripartite ATP-independent transporter DctM subunit
METGVFSLGMLIVLVFLRLPIAFSMLVVGFFGIGVTVSWSTALNLLAQTTYDSTLNYELSVVPLFILMGNFIARSGLAEDLYAACNSFVGHRRGGLSMATILACGGFSAVCGSSLATAATMSQVAMPSMRKYNYHEGFAAGSIAAGGTLGILIPPSVILVLYGIMTQSNIGKLFVAGLLPGLIGIIFYLLAVQVVTMIDPSKGPVGERSNWTERLLHLKGIWAIVLLFVFVIGGIYGGLFTPTEAAGIGASCAFIITTLKRKMTFEKVKNILIETAETSAVLFVLLIGATLFANLISFSGMSESIIDFINSLNVGPWMVMLIILGIYLLLGCVLDSLGMILLTVPVFVPLVSSMGFDLIWFGIVVVVVTEISLITPPIGLNVFVMKSVLPDIPTRTIFAGVTPFWIADIFRLLLITYVPFVSLWLPSMMA